MKSKTLSYSEQKAYDVALKLMKLKKVPNFSWHAIDVGKVELHECNDFISQGRVKRRQIVLEWVVGQMIGDCTRKITLKILLQGYDTGEKKEEKQDLWQVISIKISQLLCENDKSVRCASQLFKLEGKKNINFFLDSEPIHF